MGCRGAGRWYWWWIRRYRPKQLSTDSKTPRMNDDDELNTFLLDNDPANLLPYSKQMLPEDPEAERLPRAHPRTFQRKLLMNFTWYDRT